MCNKILLRIYKHFKLNDVGFLEAYSTLKGINLLIDLGLTPLNIKLESINAVKVSLGLFLKGSKVNLKS